MNKSGVAAAALVAISCFAPWTGDRIFSKAYKAWEMPVQLWWDTTPAEFGRFTYIFLLVPALVLIALGAVASRMRWAMVVGGAAAIVIGLAHLKSIYSIMNDTMYRNLEGSTFSNSGLPMWLALAGGIVAVVAGIGESRRVAAVTRAA